MYLCIDTISSVAGITVIDEQFATHFILDPLNSSSGIIPTIDQALKKTKVMLPDLKGIFVIKGPGSFTGLRVGLSVANQFAHQLKLPILGLRTDEWWMYRTEKKEVTYLQTLNKAEVYAVKNSEISIVELKNLQPCLWIGQLSAAHKEKLLHEFQEISDLTSIEGTWQKICYELASGSSITRRTYALIEPFYGKEPNITKTKKHL